MMQAPVVEGCKGPCISGVQPDRASLEMVQLGFGHDLLAKDGDLDPIRELPEFKRLAQAASYSKSRRRVRQSGRPERRSAIRERLP